MRISHILRKPGRAARRSSAHQLPANPQLRERRPVRELLEPLPNLVIGQDVEAVAPLDAAEGEDLGGPGVNLLGQEPLDVIEHLGCHQDGVHPPVRGGAVG